MAIDWKGLISIQQRMIKAGINKVGVLDIIILKTQLTIDVQLRLQTSISNSCALKWILIV